MIDRTRAAAGADVVAVGYLNPGPRAIRDAMNRAFGSEPSEAWIGRGWETVAAAIIGYWREENIVRVFVTGINRAIHAANLVKGYSLDFMQGTHSLNAASWKDMETLYDRQLTAMLRENAKLELYGHSAGGVVCECVLAFDRAIRPERDVTIFTYGSPCPGMGGGTVPMARDARQRFMLWGDVVPFVPAWTLTQGGLTLLAVGELSVRRAQEVMHGAMVATQPHNGVMVRGRTMERRIDPFAMGPVETQVQRWINGLEAEQVNHSIAEYAAAIRGVNRDLTTGPRDEVVAIARGDVAIASELVEVHNLVIPFPLPPGPFAGLSPVMPLTIDPAGQVTTVDGRNVGTAVLTGSGTMFLRIGPKTKFRQQKVGRTWQVVRGNSVVAICDDGHKCNAMVKRINGFLASVTTTTTLYSEAFLAELANAFSECAAGPPACRPAMRVDL